MTYTPQFPPPPNPYQPDSPPRSHIWLWIVAASSVAVAVVIVPVVILAGSNSHARTTPALTDPSAAVAVPHDFRNRAVLERSIRAETIRKAAHEPFVVTVGQVGCVGIGVRHWECNVNLNIPATAGPDGYTIDVRVTRNYQRWISTGR